MLCVTFALGWAIRSVGLAPYRIGIFFFCDLADTIGLISEWCLHFSIYLETKKDPTYIEYPCDNPDEWAYFYEYHDWLVDAGLPIPAGLTRQLQHIQQHLLPRQFQ